MKTLLTSYSEIHALLREEWRISARLHVPRMRVWRKLHADGMYPYHIQHIQHLEPADMCSRLELCRGTNANPHKMRNNFFFRDGTSLSGDWIHNTRNSHLWDRDNPRGTVKNKYQYPFSVNEWGDVAWCGVVWCGVMWCDVMWCGVMWCDVMWCDVVWCGVVWCDVVWCGVMCVVWRGVVWCGVVWCHRWPTDWSVHFSTTSDRWYLRHVMQHELPALLENVPLQTRSQICHQHDGAPPHFSQVIRPYLKLKFANRWIGRGGALNWPPRSPVLIPLGYHMWGYMKAMVYAHKVNTREELLQRILRTARSINNAAVLRKVTSSVVTLVR